MAWKTLSRWMRHLEGRDELIRISRPVDVVYEAGAIADLLVKNADLPFYLNNHAWQTDPYLLSLW